MPEPDAADGSRSESAHPTPFGDDEVQVEAFSDPASGQPRRRRFAVLDHVRSWGGRRRPANGPSVTVAPALPEDDLDRVASTIEDALSRREPVARREAAARLVGLYDSLDGQGQRRFFDLLASRFGADGDAITRAARAFDAAVEADERVSAEHELREAVKPRYARLFRVLTGLPNGVKLLVDLRADLLPAARNDPALALLDEALAAHLSSLFDVGLLELRRITWDASPAALLERLIGYEAVHEISGWNDLKDRLDRDRRCYAFLHPAMPDEPLVFVEVALTKGLADRLPVLLDRDLPVTDPADADSAIFYSITNCQRGLAGVDLGNELIKVVVQTLRRDLPHLQRFATLSPLPGFRAWVEAVLAAARLTPGERELLGAPAAAMLAALEATGSGASPAMPHNVRRTVIALAARYLTQPVNGRALDPVGNFHLANGARVERLNWMGNPAPYELRRSYGLMANYCYELDQIEANAERYLADGVIAASADVTDLLR